MTRNEAFRQLMLGLVYPAVLGTVLYVVLGTALAPFLAILSGQSAVAPAPLLKWVLLVTTVLFYCCDYLYIMFTEKFRLLFFVFDLILLTGLYVTFSMIDIATPTLPHGNVTVVAVCYVIFMALYLVWDLIERRNTHNSDEQKLYNKVILWERVSLVILGVWLGLQRWIQTRVSAVPSWLRLCS